MVFSGDDNGDGGGGGGGGGGSGDNGDGDGGDDACNELAMAVLRPWLQWGASVLPKRPTTQKRGCMARRRLLCRRWRRAADAWARRHAAAAAAAARVKLLRRFAAEGVAFESLVGRAVLPKLAAALREMPIDCIGGTGDSEGGDVAALRALLKWDSECLMPRDAVLCALEGEFFPRWTRVLLDSIGVGALPGEARARARAQARPWSGRRRRRRLPILPRLQSGAPRSTAHGRRGRGHATGDLE